MASTATPGKRTKTLLLPRLKGFQCISGPAGEDVCCVEYRSLIATRLDKEIVHVAVLVNRTPEILALALNRDEDLVQVPSIAEATLAALQSTSVFRPELDAPKSDGFI